jgi:hypothetical protein
MGQPETKVEDLCVELGVTRQTLYRHAAPDGSLRADGRRLLARKKAWAAAAYYLTRNDCAVPQFPEGRLCGLCWKPLSASFYLYAGHREVLQLRVLSGVDV